MMGLSIGLAVKRQESINQAFYVPNYVPVQ